MYKLIACDLDGTLLDSNHEITEDNKNVVKALQEKNIPFVIATGRIYPSAKEYSKLLKLETPIIACNGAVVMDPITEKVMFDYPVDTKIMLDIIKICKKYDIYFHIYTLDTVYAERNERLIKMYNDWKENNPDTNLVKTMIVSDIEDIVKENTVYKLGLYIDEKGAKEAYDEITKIIGITSCFSLNTLVDIFNIEASKGVAVKKLAGKFGINTKNIMTIGDNENDIDMLEVAGLGVAMLDARENVKNSADYIADSNDNSGVAKAIKKYLKI